METAIHTEDYSLHRKSPKRKSIKSIIITVITIVGCLLFGVYAWLFLVPNATQIQTYSLENATLILDNELIHSAQSEGKVIEIIENQAYLSYDFVKSNFDPYIHWDETNQLLIMTTETVVLEMKTDQLTAFMNDQSIALEVPVTVVDNEPFLPIEFFAKYYKIMTQYYPETNTLIIDSIGIPVQRGVVGKDESKIRLDANVKEPIVAHISKDTKLYILGEKGSWYKVRTEEGIFGFGLKSDIQLAGIKIHEAIKEERKLAWKPLGGRINLTWEHVHRVTPDPKDLPVMPGVNVISPTWFHLKDAQGNVSGEKASKEYVKWAHDRGYQVWALYSNQFDPELTKDFLRNPEARKRSIQQILGYAEMYQLDGINIDFENVYLENKDLLTQYVRELAPYLREQGLVVSIDVTIISQSPNWSMVYDRKAFADTVDYVMVMTYDEHWGSSPVAGSVASLPWVEKGLQGVLNEVPKHKLVLGVPFYTRVWKEEMQSDGKIKVSSSAVSMQRAWDIVEEQKAEVQFDALTMQFYAEYSIGKDRYRIWLETPESMQERIKLVRKYDLAGVASWRRGFEVPEIWETIETFLLKQPAELVLEN
ncbi:hypothetical protein BHU72_10280 [Desulfuribacillus stibiiarsenatis]|uniref:GH18 domain-containing protein n=1 Tax=Desulfuribacillus stibiiarsenatis TaxID=1390249 RepID=A0A1E5L9M3_9FIRM|nr:glycosyl hydrolase family 18 protein [Desulfuribacillus stibiiarsenatis]OEH86633.1 hypothetical protein BHU72_10280 [Desulfuribacillus stibiiarsenatis]